MNYGILHNRRPDKHAGTDARNPLLNDPRMREMAKQMGLEPKDFGKEAMQLWKTLDQMAVNDPKAYQNFIADQLQDGPPPSMATAATSTPDGEPAAAQQKHTTRARSFNPKPGFVVKCTMLGPVKQQMVELKLFLNLCFHEIVDLPKNPNNNKEVPRDPRAVPTTSNLQIPLVIGALREINDFTGAPCRVIDVVFHPWVHERCAWDANFKRDIMSLAITWVQHDAKITLVSSVGKYIKSLYKGGVSIGSEIITARFPIDADGQQQQQTRTLDVKLRDEPNNQDDVEPVLTSTKSTQPPPKATVKLAMDSPLDLLKQRNQNQDEGRHASSTSDFLIAPANTQPKPPPAPTPVMKAQPQKKLIEVIEPKAPASTAPKSKPKSDSVVKRGFLNATKKPLYPKGSSEGKPASAYVNLLSRSKVVDLSEQQQQQQQQQQQHQQKQAAIQKERDQVLSFLKTDTSPPPSRQDDEQDHGDFEFERLCMEADPDLAPANARGGSAGDELAQSLFGDHLDEFAKFLGAQS